MAATEDLLKNKTPYQQFAGLRLYLKEKRRDYYVPYYGSNLK